jgi:hypothetical protein
MKAPEDFKREQRQIFVRVLVWLGLLAWAVHKMGGFGGKPEGTWALERPADAPLAPAQAPAALPDVEGALRTLDAVAASSKDCPASGVVSVTLGPGGLASASLRGKGKVECVARLAWSAKWPASRQELTLDRGIE